MDAAFSILGGGGSATPLSNAIPMGEATAATAGASEAASRGDHQHPRLTSSTRVQLDASGNATVTYTRSFAAKPAIVLTAINPSGAQVVLEVISDTMTGGVYTGCVIKGSRARPLPTLNAVSGLLTAVITGVNDLVTALTGFNIFGGSAAGVEVSVVAIQPSN